MSRKRKKFEVVYKLLDLLDKNKYETISLMYVFDKTENRKK